MLILRSHGTVKTSDAEGTRFAIVPQIGMIRVPYIRVGIVGHVMQLAGNHTIFMQLNNCTCNS